MARIEKLLAQCLDDIEAGSSVEEILDQYPQQREKLEPLLRTAQRMHSVPQVIPSSTFRSVARTRMLNVIQARASAKNRNTQENNLSSSHVWPRSSISSARAIPLPIFRFATATALVFVLLVIGGLLLRSWLGVTVARTATLTDVRGVVQVLPAGHDTWQTAKTGDQIAPGDRVRTDRADATLIFFDGSATNLAAKTELIVLQLSSRRDGHSKVIALYQQVGRTYNRVQRLPDTASRFEIKTPSASATVHGTVFTVEVLPGNATQVAVGEGSVEVTAQEETIIVPSGEATTVQPGLPPALPISAPTPLPPATTEPPISGNTPELTDTPSLIKTPQPIQSPTHTPHSTETPTYNNTPQPTLTPTPTPFLIRTPTPTPSPTWTPTPSSVRVPARTPRSTNTPTRTPRPTDTPTNTPRPTNTPTRTPRPTWTPTNTPRPTWTPTNTPRPTWTPTNTPRPTDTPTNTPRPTWTPTNTPVPTNTPTNTPVPTNTPTNTPVPTNTPTNTPRPTNTPDLTKTPQLQ